MLAALACCLALAVAIAVLAPDGLVRRLDWHLHLCWMQGFHDGLAAGNPWPRWIDAANQGFGAPVFLFYAPLAYYLGAAMIGLGLETGAALKSVYALSLLLGAAGLFVWLRPLCGAARAAAISGLGLCTLQLTSFAYHFNMPASALALGLLPWLGWALERRGTSAVGRVAVLAGVLALLIHAHLLTAFQVLLLLAAAGAVALLRSERRSFAVLVLFPATLLALLLSAAYLVPLLAQRERVHLDHLVEAPQWRITSNLLFDGAAMSTMDLANGIALLALLMAGWRATRPDVSSAGRGWLGAGAVCFLLMTPLAIPLYELATPLAWLQFGWRWQGLFLLCALRVLAEALAPRRRTEESYGNRIATPGQLSPALQLLLVSLAAGMAVPGLHEAWKVQRQAASQRVLADEARRHASMCHWPNLEYRPRSMGVAWESDLVGLSRRPTVLQGRAHVIASSAAPHVRSYEIVADLRSRLLLPQLYFPGWVARVDGAVHPLMPLPDDGRMLVELAPGRLQLELRFEAGAEQRIGLLASTAGLLLWLCLVIAARVRLHTARRFGAQSPGSTGGS